MGAKILVVDDEPINRLVLEQLLLILGCETHQAENGREALAKLSTDHFDLVLLDVHMPVLGGFEVIRRLRSGDAPSNLPVVALTADTTRPRSDYLTAGFSEYLNKPVSLHMLEGFVSALPPIASGAGA